MSEIKPGEKVEVTVLGIDDNDQIISEVTWKTYGYPDRAYANTVNNTIVGSLVELSKAFAANTKSTPKR